MLTHRNFNSFYEDPASATQAFRLRTAYYQTSSQLANNDDTYKRFHAGWLALGAAVDDLTDKTSRFSVVLAENGTEGAGRSALGQVIGETAKSVIQTMNCQYGDQFIFSGSDGLHVPFTWDEAGNLLYRGVNVNAGGVKAPPAAEPTYTLNPPAGTYSWLPDETAAANLSDDEKAWLSYYKHETDVKPDIAVNPEPGWFPATSADKVEQGWIDYYNHVADEPPTAEEPAWVTQDPDTDLYAGFPDPPADETEAQWVAYYKDQNDLTKLKRMAAEEVNVDLGMGMQELDRGVVVNGSAFNTALPGITMLGFGVDEDGDPLNIVMIQKKLGDILKNCGEDGSFHPPEDEAVSMRLMDKLKEAQAKTTSQYVELDTKAKYLQTNSSRLSDQKVTLNEQVLDIEQVDLADAISTFSWDLYCYNAALKIGNQLLSQSLIDYMN